jgi:hypothetical protein
VSWNRFWGETEVLLSYIADEKLDPACQNGGFHKIRPIL